MILKKVLRKIFEEVENASIATSIADNLVKNQPVHCSATLPALSPNGILKFREKFKICLPFNCILAEFDFF